MKKFIRSISVATLAMAMAIPAMADRVLNADVVVVGAGAAVRLLPRALRKPV